MVLGKPWSGSCWSVCVTEMGISSENWREVSRRQGRRGIPGQWRAGSRVTVPIFFCGARVHPSPPLLPCGLLVPLQEASPSWKALPSRASSALGVGSLHTVRPESPNPRALFLASQPHTVPWGEARSGDPALGVVPAGRSPERPSHLALPRPPTPGPSGATARGVPVGSLDPVPWPPGRRSSLGGGGVPRGASDHTLLLVPQMSWASLRAAFPALSPAQLHRLLTQYQLASAMGPMSAWEPDARDSPEAFKSGEPDQRREQGRASWGDFQKSLQSLSPPPWWLSQLEVREPTARFRLWGQVQGPTYPTWGLMAGPCLAHTAHQEENRVSAWSAKMVGRPRTHVCSHAAYVYVHVMLLTNRCTSRR